MSIAGLSFQQVAALQRPFTLSLGRLLVANGVVTQGDYDLAGVAQAHTMVIADLYDTRHDLQPVIVSAFPKRVKGQIVPGIDLNAVAFMYAKDKIVGELDDFLRGKLGVTDLDARLQVAKAAVDREAGVHANAASAGALHKGLFLTRDERQAVVEASLMMQMSTRGMVRVQAIELGQANRVEAMRTHGLHNKINYELDSETLSEMNESLLNVCLIETAMHRSALKAQAGHTASRELKSIHDVMLKHHVGILVDAMPVAIGLYHQVGRTEIADKAHQVYDANKSALSSYYINPESSVIVPAGPVPVRH